ncbi:MAG: hypothetical protein ACHQRM_05825 [Bacteroidia bacterium]
MKTLVIIIALAFASVNSTRAQIGISVNIGLQPVWGPAGYDYAEYYYMPEIEAYYYVPEHRFYYREGDVWVNSYSLPGRYRDFDLYRTHKIVINEPRPYLRHEYYRGRYSSYRGYRGQPVIRDSHDSRYWEIREHPEHGKWKGNEGRHEGHREHGGR